MKQGWRYELKDYSDRGIWGFIPIYDSYGGNYTKLIFEKGSPEMIKRRLDTVITGYASLFQKDMRLIRTKARDITGQRTRNPLPVDWDIILVPFKLRKPIAKDDGALGYFLHRFIDSITKKEGNIYLCLKNGNLHKILDSQATAEKHISSAFYVQGKLQEGLKFHPKFQSFCRERSSDYNLPVTKGDLDDLVKSIKYTIVSTLKEEKK